jgi:hypothetical protein
MSRSTLTFFHKEQSPAAFQLATIAGASIFVAGGILTALHWWRPANWWAFFILLPAIALLAAGGRIALSMRRLHPMATILAAPGIVPLTVACMFLAPADWRVDWPMMIAAPGAMLILIGVSSVRHPVTRAWFRTVLAIGVMLIVLAGIFSSGMRILDAHWIPSHGFAWWGVPMLIPGLAALYNATAAARIIGARSHPGIRLLIASGLSICAVAAATLEGASGNVQISVGLMAGGLGLLL